MNVLLQFRHIMPGILPDYGRKVTNNRRIRVVHPVKVSMLNAGYDPLFSTPMKLQNEAQKGMCRLGSGMRRKTASGTTLLVVPGAKPIGSLSTTRPMVNRSNPRMSR